MKVVLRNKKTGQFFKGPAVWTEQKREAFVFRDSAAAREFYLKHYIPDVQIIQTDGTGVDVPLDGDGDGPFKDSQPKRDK